MTYEIQGGLKKLGLRVCNFVTILDENVIYILFCSA
jgi:hypothetical protein